MVKHSRRHSNWRANAAAFCYNNSFFFIASHKILVLKSGCCYSSRTNSETSEVDHHQNVISRNLCQMQKKSIHGSSTVCSQTIVINNIDCTVCNFTVRVQCNVG